MRRTDYWLMDCGLQMFFIYFDVLNVLRFADNQTGIVSAFTFDVLAFGFYALEITSLVWLANSVQREVCLVVARWRGDCGRRPLISLLCDRDRGLAMRSVKWR